MRALVACEESQRVTIELRRLGVEAYSCDIQECSGGHPEWHYQGDVLPLLDGDCTFTTVGQTVSIEGKWDMIIAHPPCTYLSCAGAQRLFSSGGRIIDENRYIRAIEAAGFFKRMLSAKCDHLCVENPVIMRSKFGIPKYDQIIEPYFFGDPWHKRTCLWLYGLPKLSETNVVEPKGYWVQRSGQRARGDFSGHRDPKMRSKTFPGIARAMAEQWTDYILAEKRGNNNDK